jgi:hypothetical protein
MTYKEEVINSAIQGLRESGLSAPEAFEVLFDRIYECGYMARVSEEAGVLYNERTN